MRKTNPTSGGSLAVIEAHLQHITRLLAELLVPPPELPEVDYSELNYKTLDEAAEALGVSVVLMRQIVHKEGFPGYKAGTRWIIPKAELAAWNAKMAKEKAEL